MPSNSPSFCFSSEVSAVSSAAASICDSCITMLLMPEEAVYLILGLTLMDDVSDMPLPSVTSTV